MQKKYLFTSESVSEGHPDKVADLISDSILDEIYKTDPLSRVACETLVTTGLAVVGGEITTSAVIDYQSVVRNTIKNIGYTDKKYGFDGDGCGVLIALDKQSPDISQGVTEGQGLHNEQGAGDQGMMLGYASDETPELMPAPIILAHKLLLKLSEARKSGEIPNIGPDSKSQVTVEYEGRIPKRVNTVVISTQHLEEMTLEMLKQEVTEKIIKKIIPQDLMTDDMIIHVNPTGRFVIGGPHGDCGLTGRKIIVDTYGGKSRHGGGAFSGKDPSKVDRSAAYMCRYIAKNVVAAELANECEVELAYAIGVAEPVSVFVETFGTNKVDEEKIEKAISEVFKLTPKGIIDSLNLRRPIFSKTTNYGHFGRAEEEFIWEKTDKAEELKKLC